MFEETDEEKAMREATGADKVDEEYAKHIKISSNMTWFDRAYVKEKLDADKYVNCAKEKKKKNIDEEGEGQGEGQGQGGGAHRRSPLPSMAGLPLDPPLDTEKFLWTPGHDQTEEDEAGEESLEAAKAAAERAAEDTRSPASAQGWGTCALVGNSGLLKFSTFGRSIDSHDTVVRVNQAPQRGYSRRVGLKVTHR